MTLTVVPLYAAILTGVYLTLCIRVIRYRRGNRLSLGDEGDRRLLCLMRAQANCAEYAPIGLVLLLIAELQGAPALALHVLGLLLLGGRIAHAYGFTAQPMIMNLRVAGMAMTLTMLIFSALGLLFHALF